MIKNRSVFQKIGDYVEGLLKNPTAVPLSLAVSFVTFLIILVKFLFIVEVISIEHAINGMLSKNNSTIIKYF